MIKIIGTPIQRIGYNVFESINKRIHVSKITINQKSSKESSYEHNLFDFWSIQFPTSKMVISLTMASIQISFPVFCVIFMCGGIDAMPQLARTPILQKVALLSPHTVVLRILLVGLIGLPIRARAHGFHVLLWAFATRMAIIIAKRYSSMRRNWQRNPWHAMNCLNFRHRKS